MIVKDTWLSEKLGRPVYNLKLENHGETDWKTELLDKMNQPGQTFAFCKVKSDDLERIWLLEEIGFRLADTQVTFQKKIEPPFSEINQDVKPATAIHQKGVERIAEKNFIFSRFHLDPKISDKVANDIKKEWAGNYLKDLRGDELLVYSTGDTVAGFLQLIHGGSNCLVIDLIAVDKEFRRRRVAEDLIRYAESHTGMEYFRVGTQVANIPSIRLYEKLGFRLIESSYIYHMHGGQN